MPSVAASQRNMISEQSEEKCMPTTVVTGASGKVGWWVVNAFVEAGHDVRAVDRTALPEPFTW